MEIMVVETSKEEEMGNTGETGEMEEMEETEEMEEMGAMDNLGKVSFSQWMET